ncbi:MAG: hypothetical protein KKC79_05550 [Gammaproteobacteria bacterium]|nr:hypothetical protein [Gammaproteobacteria bacterium]MBU1440875.1 hypothetical protein [Gammaproteobacteria bacterium]MBU2285839.1 hypothetical protein [Gammaproteobacteria bacterium]MBU2408099.1 hypothetical protein [Gammaproteobacteria bacterium]
MSKPHSQSGSQSLRNMRPYHKLFLAVLVGVALVQVGAMILVTREQVQKARDFYAAQETEPRTDRSSGKASAEQRAAPADDATQVSYLQPR